MECWLFLGLLRLLGVSLLLLLLGVGRLEGLPYQGYQLLRLGTRIQQLVDYLNQPLQPLGDCATQGRKTVGESQPEFTQTIKKYNILETKYTSTGI